MANKLCMLFLAFVTVISVLEVVTDRHHDEGTHDEEAFQEFDEDPDYKYSNTANEKVDDLLENNDAEIEIRSPTGSEPVKPFKTPMNMPPVKFAFCVSCGYRQAFDQFSEVIREKYPGVVIEGVNFPPSKVKSLLSQFIGVAKIAVIVMVIVGRDPFVSMGMATPGVFNWMLNNKLSSCLMLFMLSNSIEGMLMSTGAFEIYLGDQQIWSKLESGRVPSPIELIQAIDSHLALSSKGTGSFGFENE